MDHVPGNDSPSVYHPSPAGDTRAAPGRAARARTGLTNRSRPPVVRVGDIVVAEEGSYRFGLGPLALEVVEIGARERHADGLWIELRGVELRQADTARLRQRRVLVRLDAARIRPGLLSRRRRAGAARLAALAPPTPPAPAARQAAHLPVRPTWACIGCGDPWPCAAARAHLLAEHADDQLMLSVHLARHLVDAISDLPPGKPGERYARFLGWARRR
jgi:hypothetical protein